MAKAPTFDDIYEKGLDVKNRRIYLGALELIDNENGLEGGNISWGSIELVIRAIHFLESKSTTQPIELHISSTGGELEEALRLVDVILASPCQIKFFGGGNIMSAGTVIMCVCDERMLYPSTAVMVHEPSSGVIGTATEMGIAHADMEHARMKLIQLYAANSRMPENFWTEILRRDLYITAQEAVELGLADKIIEPKKRGTLRKVRTAHLSTPVDKKDLSRLIKSLHRRVYKGNLNHIELVIPNEQFDESLKIEPILEQAEESYPAQ